MAESRLETRQTQKLSHSLQMAIRLLSLDLDALNEAMLRAVQENPALESVPPAKTARDYAVTVRSGGHAGKGAAAGFEPAAKADTAMADLEQQLRLSGLDAQTERAALLMLHLLSPRGYFPQDVRSFAAEAGISEETATRALSALQALEPAGIGARTLEECLLLQLRGVPGADPLCGELIRSHLPDIGNGRIASIARATGASPERIKACIQTVRRLNPVPCALYPQAVQYIMPEFTVEADAQQHLAVQFHDGYYPSLRQDPSFMRLADRLEGDEAVYARRMQAAAAQWIRAVELRRLTMEKIARIIVREQKAFFLRQYSLVPLRVDEAAEEIGVHASTVYRALRGKYLSCARGTFPLRFFFQKEVSAGVSAARARELIRGMCAENGSLSDRAISEALEKRGILLSRRTVAKYRAQMEIDASYRRRAQQKEFTP
ncbi:MAG: RNA polymerase factor sigma-54 [Clostridia bacterium]|nr:RNA polymerase factor sigma-54 [Clostridia bacterium]